MKKSPEFCNSGLNPLLRVEETSLQFNQEVSPPQQLSDNCNTFKQHFLQSMKE